MRFRLMPYMRDLAGRYARLFSIAEIESRQILQWYFGASLFFFFIAFQYFLRMSIGTIEHAERGLDACWPTFQNCGWLAFLHDMNHGYSQSLFYMGLYGVMVVIIWCIWRKRWDIAHPLLLTLFLWESFVVFVQAYQIVAPYYYYHLFLTAVLLFLPFKEYFLKLVFVLLYFMSVTVKLDDTWVLGTYFSSLKYGLPLVPDSLIPIATNIVVLSQVVGCWFLLSSKRLYQRIAFCFFLFFHLYSGIFVQYMYPSTSILPLVVLFGPLYRFTPTPFARRAFAGWLLVALIALFQALGFAVPTDRRLTLEGNRFGMFMFEANHQCIITEKSYSAADRVIPDMRYSAGSNASCNDLYCQTAFSLSQESGETVRTQVWHSASSLYRCDPYDWWFKIQAQCASGAYSRIAFSMLHSINGGPFYEIVNEANLCDVAYRPFVHNSWIKVPPEARTMGYPVENIY